mmetsp:Transcript_46310/g.39021  ORF Transcript_46310/g.39021 Transcript_46310/m.39021 type:complete len:132 (-) Transcript_46310:430-825(-)
MKKNINLITYPFKKEQNDSETELNKNITSIDYPMYHGKVRSPIPHHELMGVHSGNKVSLNLGDLKGSWFILLFFPKAFTYVCPTELIGFEEVLGDLNELNCKMLAVSTDSVEILSKWLNTSRKKGGIQDLK